jgi:hypothetical protein
MRQLRKGMGANLDGQIRREKARLLQKIKGLDEKADQLGLFREGAGWDIQL